MLEWGASSAEIDTEMDDIPVRDLSYFLYYFRAAYVTALQEVETENVGHEFGNDEVEQLASAVSKELGSVDYPAVPRKALADLPSEQELTFRDISRRNPIDIVFGGVAIALAAAVILSGGEFKIDKQGLRVKLPPLGVGVAELKKALNGQFEGGPKRARTDENDSDDSLGHSEYDDPSLGS